MKREKGRMGELWAITRDAAIVSLVAAGIGMIVNTMHPRAIPFIAEVEYEVMVPCPEPGGDAQAIEADDPDLGDKGIFFVDARIKEEFSSWRYKEATNLTYDYLDPTPDALIQDLARAIASSRSRKVVVYGDGDQPDTGEMLGKEISGRGIKNVFFVRGGAPALKATVKGGGAE
jgi:hypothetical protein